MLFRGRFAGFGLSLGLVGMTGVVGTAGRFSCIGLNSRSLSGLGAGDIGRDGG